MIGWRDSCVIDVLLLDDVLCLRIEQFVRAAVSSANVWSICSSVVKMTVCYSIEIPVIPVILLETLVSHWWFLHGILMKLTTM